MITLDFSRGKGVSIRMMIQNNSEITSPWRFIVVKGLVIFCVMELRLMRKSI